MRNFARNLVAFFAPLILGGFFGLAQTVTTSVTSGPIVDSDGQAWINGTWSASLYNPSGGQRPVYTQTGLPVPTLIQNQTLDGTGSLSYGVWPDNNQITPSFTQWIITVCSNTSAACVTLPNITITGASQSITAFLNATIGLTANAPRFSPGANSRGYIDAEVLNPIAGSQYYKVIPTTCTRVYSGTAWACSGSGFGTTIVPGTNITCSPGSPTCNGVVTVNASAAANSPALGNIYNANTWADLSAFLLNGTTPTIRTAGTASCPAGTNSCLEFSAGAGLQTYTQSASVNYYSTAQQFTETVSYVVGTKSASSYGVPIGVTGAFLTTTHGGAGMVARVDCTTGANAGQLTLVSLNGTIPQTVGTSQSNLTITAGDTIVVTLSRIYDWYVATAYDQTTGSALVTANAIGSTDSVDLFLPTNLVQYAIYNEGGTQTVTSWLVNSSLPKSPDVLVYGESKSFGNTTLLYSNYSNLVGIGTYGLGFASLLQQGDLVNSNFQRMVVLNESAPAANTQDRLNWLPEVLALKPKVVLLESPGIDMSLPGTWQPLLTNIISQLQAAGIKVYNLYIDDAGGPYAVYTTWVNTNYPGTLLDSNLENWSANWSTVLNADNTHPNRFGHQIVATSISNRLVADGQLVAYRPYDYNDYHGTSFTANSRLNLGVPFQSGILNINATSFLAGNFQPAFLFGSNNAANSTQASVIGFLGMTTESTNPTYLRLTFAPNATANQRVYQWQTFSAGSAQGIQQFQPAGGAYAFGPINDAGTAGSGGGDFAASVPKATGSAFTQFMRVGVTNDATNPNYLSIAYDANATATLRGYNVNIRSENNWQGIYGLQTQGNGTVQLGPERGVGNNLLVGAITNAGWGTGGGASSASGNSNRMRFTMTAGTTPLANPTFSILLPTPMDAAMRCIALMTGGTGVWTNILTGTETATNTGTFTFNGTPVNGSTYIITVDCQ